MITSSYKEHEKYDYRTKKHELCVQWTQTLVNKRWEFDLLLGWNINASVWMTEKRKKNTNQISQSGKKC